MTDLLQDEMKTFLAKLKEEVKPTELDNLQPKELPTESFDVATLNHLAS